MWSTGMLSLQEVEQGVLQLLGLDTVAFDPRPAIQQAFHVAKNFGIEKEQQGTAGSKNVQQREFRVLLQVHIS